MKKRGFTLVELLAVIVILAVIALIATPVVLSMIESSRKGAAESSMVNYVRAVENTILMKQIEANVDQNYDQKYKVVGKTLKFIGENPFQLEVEIKGEEPAKEEDNYIIVQENMVVEAKIRFGNYYVSYWYQKDTGKPKYCSSTKGYPVACDTDEVSTPETKEYKEAILNGADPELYQGMIPIEISDTGVITKASTKNAWYSYADKKWANAVLVSGGTYEVGQVIPEDKILMYYVWIPRYKYQLFNTNNKGIDPVQISITFEDKGTTKSNGTTNGEWLTHPAFTFGDTELNGYWVAKFETTGTAGTDDSPTNLTSKPGVTAFTNINVSTMFNVTRAIDTKYASSYGLKSSEIDTHMMKNMEWGAMAYLSHSKYGTCTNGTCTEITYNSNSSYLTGGSNSPTAWANTYMMQSTTRNRYGIYDTSGGAWEYVMGNMTNSTTEANSSHFYSSGAGFGAPPEDKYIDYYTYDASSYTTHARGRLGDATKETLQTFGSNTGGWYGDDAQFPYSTTSWFIRGRQYADGATLTGVFAFHRETGGAGGAHSFRVVLSQED